MIGKEFQRRGYGKAVIPVIIQYFRQEGVKELRLSTKPDNSSALALYHQYGFVETGQYLDDEVELILMLK